MTRGRRMRCALSAFSFMTGVSGGHCGAEADTTGAIAATVHAIRVFRLDISRSPPARHSWIASWPKRFHPLDDSSFPMRTLARLSGAARSIRILSQHVVTVGGDSQEVARLQRLQDRVA